jgi:hypothetical protein
MRRPKRTSSVMFCLGIALGYAGNLAIPQQSVLIMIVGITTALILLAVLALLHKDHWDNVLDMLALDVGVAAFITPKTLSALWVIIFLSLAVIFSIVDLFLLSKRLGIGSKGSSSDTSLRPSLLITLVLGASIVILGLLVTGDFAKPWTGWPGYNSALGYTFADVGLGAFIVYIFIDTLLLREKRQHWKEVGVRARKLVKTELMGILVDVIFSTNLTRGSFGSNSASEEELLRAEKEATVKAMENQANDLSAIRDSVSEDLLDGKHGDIFSLRAKRLGNLQLRYWSNFLEPKLVALMMDLEQLLDVLDTHIKIVAQDRVRERSRTPSILSKQLSLMYVEQVYKDLQPLLRKLLEGVNENLIEVP